MTNLERRKLVRGRIIEAAREIGTLLIALSPLDWILSAPSRRLALLGVFMFGIVLLAAAIAAERSIRDGG